MKKVWKIMGALLMACVLAVVVSIAVCAGVMKTTRYDVAVDGITSNAKVVCISDLHQKEYGKDNSRLIKKVAQEKPDAIFVLGDMIKADASEEDINSFLRLLTSLLDVAPVYVSPGNQEMDYILEVSDSLVSKIEKTGAVYLCDTYVDASLGGNPVRIGGSLGHYYKYEWTDLEKDNPPDYALEKEVGKTNVPSFVLLHMPESLFTDCAAEKWTGDYYFCGHTHGGVVQIPFVGGLYAPTQGYFPSYDKGLFEAWGQNFFITSGLSGYKFVPRIFNLPEIMVVNFTPVQ